MFRRKFWVSLGLTIPTLLWGHMLPRLVGAPAPLLPGGDWVAPVFGTAVFLYGGWVFIQGASRELRARIPGMMTLIALAISVAFLFSAAVTLGYPGMPQALVPWCSEHHLIRSLSELDEGLVEVLARL